MLIAQRLRTAIPMSILLMLLSISTIVIAQSCPVMLDLVEAAAQTCADLDNEACVGTEPVLLQDNAGNPLFAARGSRHPVSALGLVEPQSETAMVPFRVKWDEQPLDFIIFGSVRTQNEIPVASAPITAAPLSAVVRTDGRDAILRRAPSTASAVETTIPSGVMVTIYERIRTSDIDWVFVSYTSDDRILYGWMASSLLAEIDINAVPASATIDDPWQSFNVTGNAQLPSCDSVPSGGVLLQSPQGGVVSFQVNGVLVYMGSTVLIRPLVDGGVRIINLEGNVAVRNTGNVVVNVTVGHYVEVNGAGFVSTTITQISYSDGQGVQNFTAINININIDILLERILLPREVEVEDIWGCAAGGSSLTVPSATWLIFKVYSTSNDDYDELQDFRASGQYLDNSVVVDGVQAERVGYSSIFQNGPDWYSCEPIYTDGKLTGCRKLTREETTNPYYVPQPNWSYIEYYAIPPMEAGSYIGTRDSGQAQCPITVTPSTPQTVTVIYDPRNPWENTGIRLRAEQQVTIFASGEINLVDGDPNASWLGPDGVNYPCVSEPNQIPCTVENIGYGLLLARVGGEILQIGSQRSFLAPNDGMLYLAANDRWNWADNVGSYTVEITVGP